MSPALLFHYLLLNMFRMLVHQIQELAAYCRFISSVVLLWFDVCCCYGVVRPGWCGIIKEIHAILTETLACFLPGRANDLSAPL